MAIFSWFKLDFKNIMVYILSHDKYVVILFKDFKWYDTMNIIIYNKIKSRP
jgi:hypothetical protein